MLMKLMKKLSGHTKISDFPKREYSKIIDGHRQLGALYTFKP